VSAIRVILVTVAGPAGHVDVGVRSDATPAELAASLSSILGVNELWPSAEHRSPPRPGEPRGRRSLLMPTDSLADAGVTDGDLILLRSSQENSHGSGALDASTAQDRAADGQAGRAWQADAGFEQGAGPHD
jgi:hypothetical protein